MVLGYSLQLTVSTHIKGKKSYSCITIGQKILVFWYSRANLFIEIAQIFKFLLFSKAFHPVHLSGPNFNDRFSINFRDHSKYNYNITI